MSDDLIRCRKCDATRADRDAACPRCGLAPAHADTWAARAAVPPTASLEQAWDAAVDAWDDPAAHERASTAALATSDYAWLAGRYREVLRERPDDAIARARLDLLARRAAAALTATGDGRGRGKTKRLSLVPVFIAVAAIAVGTFYAAYLTRRRAEAAGRRRPVEAITRPPRQLPGPAIEPTGPAR